MATEKQIITAYNGTQITFYPTSHRYKLENEKTYLLSPSSIVGIMDKSQALLTWNDNLIKGRVASIDEVEYNKNDVITLVDSLLNVRKEKLEVAGETGDIVHDYAEQTAYCKAYNQPLPEIDLDTLSEEQVRGITSFIKFNGENNPKYIEAERFVFSQNNGEKYIGKLDTMFEINGITYLGDFKTSKNVYFSHKVQLALYDLALIEEYNFKNQPLPYTNLAIVHLDKNTGEYTIHYISEEERKDLHGAAISALKLKALDKKYNKWEAK